MQKSGHKKINLTFNQLQSDQDEFRFYLGSISMCINLGDTEENATAVQSQQPKTHVDNLLGVVVLQ